MQNQSVFQYYRALCIQRKEANNFSKVTGEYTPQLITLAKEVYATYTNRFIACMGKALHKGCFCKWITSFGRNTSCTRLYGEKQPVTATQ